MNIRNLTSIVAFCTVVFILCGCTNSNNQNHDKNYNDENSKISFSESEINNVNEKTFYTYLYSAIEENYILSEKRCTTFDTCKYIDSKAELQKQLIINGVEYSMTYEESAVLAISDLAVHTYKIDGLKNARVLVDAMNGNVIKYVNIPYTEVLSSEKDYLDFMKKIYPSANYSTYDYKCMTQCYYTSESGIRSRVENGFLLENESRTTSCYYFFFTQSIDFAKTENHISAIFDSDNTFTLEVHDFDYSMDEFQLILNSSTELDSELKKYVKDNLKPEFELLACDIGQQKLFVKNGKPYVLTTVSVTFTQIGDPSLSQYTTNLQIINGLKD